MFRSFLLAVLFSLLILPLGIMAQTTPAPAADQGPTPATDAATAVPEAPAPTAAELADAVARIGILNEQIASLTSDLNGAEARLGELEKDLDAERQGRASDAEASGALQTDLFAAIDTANTEVGDLKAQLSERDGLADRLAALEAEKESISRSLGSEREGKIDLSAWPQLLVSGFDAAKPRIGKWKIAGGVAEQTNAKEFFSRLEMPLEQKGKAYLYRFTTSSSGKGWVGLGLHLFSSNVRSKRGYGEGRSLLVWFTRDQAVRRTNDTWLQLYRSDNDVIMERVLDAKIEQGIGDSLAVEVLYDPASGYLTIAVNGSLAVRYRAWFGIEEGVGVSLRTLGAGGRFSDFEIRAAE
jgi:hypothetical protein